MTASPSGPAGQTKSTSPLTCRPPVTVTGVSLRSATPPGRTVTGARLPLPDKRAVMVPVWVVVTGESVGAKLTLLAPSGTFTLGGIVTAALVLLRVTVAPPAGAGDVSVTEPVT